jgi:hypothetical protein
MARDPRMSDNPFQSPTTDSRIVGVRSGSRGELHSVAKNQKGVLFCLLAQLLGGIGVIALEPTLPEAAMLMLRIGLLGVGLASLVFVFRLAVNVYPTWVGIVLGIFALVPCIGLLVLLAVNGKATSVLRHNRIKVGFMGADLSQF